MDIAAVFEDPGLMLFGLEGNIARFVRMTRQSYADSIFFDQRLKPAEQGLIAVPLAPLLDHLDRAGFAPPGLRFIHHFAHSGSTLLARALDQPANLVIREPAHLRQIGVARGAGAEDSLSDRQRALLAFSLTMLGKRFAPGSTVIVKGNVPISLLAEPISDMDPGQPAILLYFPLEDYCAAVLRSPGHRNWVERVTADMALRRDPLVGDLNGLTVAEKAAALWYSMMKRFERLLARHPEMRSLDANQLFDRPAETIAAASSLFGAGLDAQQAETIARSTLFSTYSKNPDVPFDNSVRRNRMEAVKAELAEDLRRARRWVETHAPDDAVGEALERPLGGHHPR